MDEALKFFITTKKIGKLITEFESRQTSKKQKEEKIKTNTLRRSLNKKLISSPTNFQILTKVELKDSNNTSRRYQVIILYILKN
jgi:hypothetical protein